MSARLPSLLGLRAFEAVARLGSVRAAGEELAVSPTVISRHLRNLQLDLGVALLVPQGRGLALTPAGEAFQAKVARAFALLRQATDELRPAQGHNLELWCTPGLANKRLLPRLPELESRLPGWDIVLQPTLAHPHFERGEAAAEIVYSYEELVPAPGLGAELLARPLVFPVASPALRERLAPVLTARDLLKGPLIHEESTENWERWFEQAGVQPLPPLRGPRLWHAHLALDAARLGQGIALANSLIAEEDLAQGRLVALDVGAVRLGGYYLVAPSGGWRAPPLVALRDWLKTALAGEGADSAIAASNATVAVS